MHVCTVNGCETASTVHIWTFNMHAHMYAHVMHACLLVSAGMLLCTVVQCVGGHHRNKMGVLFLWWTHRVPTVGVCTCEATYRLAVCFPRGSQSPTHNCSPCSILP